MHLPAIPARPNTLHNSNERPASPPSPQRAPASNPPATPSPPSPRANTTSTAERFALMTRDRTVSSSQSGAAITSVASAGKNVDTKADTSSSPLIAKIGYEMEIPGVEVKPFLPRGTVLMEGSGWKLETDADLNNRTADLEFVLAPMSSMPEIEIAMQEITDLVGKMREKALGAPDGEVPLASLTEHGRQACVLKVNDVRFGAVLQATYGVGLEKMADSVDRLLDEKYATAIHAATQKVASHYQEKHGSPLSEASKGFVELINLYLERAKSTMPHSGTVHSLFRMMARSDFCSMYDKLLNDADREQLNHLFLAREGEDKPAFVAALSLDAGALVFKKPYRSAEMEPTERGLERKKETGPTISDWLASIVNGRGDGAFRKDLMSPPPGYPLHTGNLDVDYGMGAMRVDEENKLILFEIRGSVHRPRKIPMNEQIKHAVVREYMDAQEYNSSLPAIGNAYSPAAPAYAALNLIETSYEDLGKVSSMIAAYGSELSARSWKGIKSLSLARAQRSIADAEQALMTEGKLSFAPALKAPLAEMKAVLTRLSGIEDPLLDPERVLSLMQPYEKAREHLEKALWYAGSLAN